MPKRVLGNISNTTTFGQIKGSKRVGSPQNKALKKLRSSLPEKKENSKKSQPQPQPKQKGTSKALEDQENTVQKKGKDVEATEFTRTIERKVKNIALRSGKDCLPTTSGNRENVSDVSVDTVTEDEEESVVMTEQPVVRYNFANPSTYYNPPADIPEHVDDFDKTQLKDINSEPHYAHDIFNYYKEKELVCKVVKYLQTQPEITKAMRSVLVDWMVEVQESFELNHETLYLAVKIVDHFLMKSKVMKSRFQLLGATAVLIAAKFDERIPPAIEDFTFICDDAYTRRDIVLMEIEVLNKLQFIIGFPISYRFLRRYARVAKLNMETLTLARFILETSLMDYDLIEERGSLLAAAALLLALKMKKVQGWTTALTYYSGYEESEITSLMYTLNDLISAPVKANLKTIRTKYSHKIFYEVAKVSPLSPIGGNKRRT